jgi:hypothetical protein
VKFVDILKRYRKIAIVGTDKNAGKTVALNEFINTAAENDIRLGITSIGRDGERLDIVTNTEKPSIYVPENTIIATAEGCLKTSEAALEILDITPFQTAIGRVVICEVRRGGYVEIAGPDSNSEIKKVSDFMLDLGVDNVLIDGALNRKTQGSPSVADGIILSTGAVLSRSIENVVEKTKHIVKVLTYPQVDKSLQRACEESANSSYVSFIDSEGRFIKTNYKTALGASANIIGELKEDYEYIVFPGTLMNSFIRAMQEVLRHKKLKLVVRDGTRIFAESMDLKIFERLGGKIEVIEPINLLAVTINPYSPEGYYFDPDLLLSAVGESLSPIDVFDCMKGGA